MANRTCRAGSALGASSPCLLPASCRCCLIAPLTPPVVCRPPPPRHLRTSVVQTACRVRREQLPHTQREGAVVVKWERTRGTPRGDMPAPTPLLPRSLSLASAPSMVDS